MFELLGQGKLRPHILGRYALPEGAQALNDMMNRKVMGKVIVYTE
jgi:NADPH2:quinone reductase